MSSVRRQRAAIARQDPLHKSSFCRQDSAMHPNFKKVGPVVPVSKTPPVIKEVEADLDPVDEMSEEDTDPIVSDDETEDPVAAFQKGREHLRREFFNDMEMWRAAVGIPELNSWLKEAHANKSRPAPIQTTLDKEKKPHLKRQRTDQTETEVLSLLD